MHEAVTRALRSPGVLKIYSINIVNAVPRAMRRFRNSLVRLGVRPQTTRLLCSSGKRGSGVRTTWQRYADPLRPAKTTRGQRALSLHLQPHAVLMHTRDDCVGLRASKPLVGSRGHHVVSL